jgi:hypothetical protein
MAGLLTKLEPHDRKAKRISLEIAHAIAVFCSGNQDETLEIGQ